MLIIFKLLLLLIFFYSLGLFLFKILLKLNIIENYTDSLVVKLLISIIFINNFIIFGIKLDYFIYLLYTSLLFFIVYLFSNRL